MVDIASGIKWQVAVRRWTLVLMSHFSSATFLRVPVLCLHTPIIPTTRDVHFRTWTILVPYMLCHHWLLDIVIMSVFVYSKGFMCNADLLCFVLIWVFGIYFHISFWYLSWFVGAGCTADRRGGKVPEKCNGPWRCLWRRLCRGTWWLCGCVSTFIGD